MIDKGLIVGAATAATDPTRYYRLAGGMQEPEAEL